MPLTKPDAIRHLNKARTNYALYEELKAGGSHLDWAVTVLFYTALHLIQARLVESAATGFDIPHDHPERDSAVARLLPSVYTNFRFLTTRSQWARYYPDKPAPTVEQLRDFEKRHFDPIRKALEAVGIALDEYDCPL